MADFSVPFARDASKRLPTAVEKTGGFPCGEADQNLFNGLIHQLQAEIGTVLRQSGITQDDTVFTSLYDAIVALVVARVAGTQFASTVETLAGTIANKALSPATGNALITDLETRAPWAGAIPNIAYATIAEHLAGLIANKAATPAGVKAVIDALIASAPGALDTLNELAAALGDDANFSVTMNAALAARVKLDGTTPFTAVQRGVTPGNNPNVLDLVTVQYLRNNAGGGGVSLSPEFSVGSADVVRNTSQVLTGFKWIEVIAKVASAGVTSQRNKLANFAISNAQVSQTYLVDTGANLYTVNTATGAATLVGSITSLTNNSVFGAAEVGGVLYVLGVSGGTIWIESVDRDTLVGTMVALSNITASVAGAAPASQTDIYVLSNGSPHTLRRINLSINSATVVNTHNVAAGGTVASLAELSGTLYTVDNNDSHLISIDPTDGSFVDLGVLNPAVDIHGMTNIGGTIYAVSRDTDSLYTLNTATRALTLIGALSGPTLPNALAMFEATLTSLGDVFRLSTNERLQVWRPAGTDSQLAFRRSGTSSDIEVIDVIGIA